MFSPKFEVSIDPKIHSKIQHHLDLVQDLNGDNVIQADEIGPFLEWQTGNPDFQISEVSFEDGMRPWFIKFLESLIIVYFGEKENEKEV